MSGRGRSLRPGGVVRALLRFFLLVVLGFTAGLVIGVVSEEPELLAGHLRGESRSVSLSSEAEAEADGYAGADEAEKVNSLAETASGLAAVAAPPAITPTPTPTPERVREPRPAAPAVPKRRSIQPERAAAQPPPKVSVPRQVREQAIVGRDPFAIQVGAFSDERAAQELARGLGQKGYSTSILPSSEGTRRWRVRVQPLVDEAAAQSMADRLKQDEGLPTWVLRMDPATESGRGTR